ncbi:MAG TPA: MauE/DoxX family redox-associated membrane protein [Myxococcota bacterium]|jgi:hypothetical protein|nr:MauE/DoxX family redox-associated membrane protein [Myxococcota bacterium]
MSLPVLDPALQAVLRASLALLFGLAAAHKLRAPRAFALVLAEYRLLPDAASLPLAVGLAATEIAVAVGLCAPALAPVAALAAALLLALYAGAVAINLARGRDAIDCGCGFGPRPLGAGLLLRNALLVGAALAAALPVSPRALGTVDALTIAAGTATAALVFAAADGLAARRARTA